MASVLEILVRATDQASRVIDGVGTNVTKNIDQIQTKMQTTGVIMSAAVTAPLLLLGNKATEAASDLGESVNAVNVVFGEGAAKIHAFAKVADKEAGLSMRALNELVTPVGAALQNVGFGADEAADASITLATRAADMASVFNVDVSEALGAIQAGLRGEADPLERFGVGLSQSAVVAHALELGLADTAGELDANALAQARVSLLMEQTDKLAGDFVNTSDELANKQRINAAEAENAAAAFGEKLLPVKQAIVDVMGKVLDLFTSLSPEMQTAIIVVGGVAAAIGPLLLIGSSLITVVRGIGAALMFVAANPVILIIAAIVAVVLALIWLYNNSKEFRDIVNGVFNAVAGVVRGVVDGIGRAFDDFKRGLDTVARIVGSVADGIGDAFETMASIVKGVWSGITSSIKGAINFVIGIINRMIGFLNRIRISVPAIDIPFVGTVGGFSIGLPHIPAIPRLATGAWDVLNDMLAVIHRGEMVVPASTAAGIRGAVAGGGFGGGGPLVHIEHFSGSEDESERLALLIAQRIGRR